VSSIISGNSDTHSPAVTWACLAFLAQALMIGAPLILRAGELETRVKAAEAAIEQNRARLADGQEKYTVIIDRLARIETTQRQILEAVETRSKR
jgi:hypothetical protein